MELVLDINVQISAVLGVGLDLQIACNLLAVLDRQHVLEVKDCLFPVGVFGVGTSREANGLVTCGEVNVEPGHKGVDEVVALDGELEGRGKGEVGHGAGVEVKGEDGRGIGDDSLELDGVDEGLGEGGFLERGVVEAVDIVPD